MSRNYIAEIAKLYGLELKEVFRLSGHKDKDIYISSLFMTIYKERY